MKFLFLNYNWEINEESKLLSPFFILYGVDGIIKLPINNFKFSFNISTDTYCIGYFDEENNYVPCKLNKKLSDSRFQRCFQCNQKDGFFNSFFLKKEKNIKMEKFLKKDQQIYLAYFNNNIIKVGTSSRGKKRLIEQDALVFAFIAKEAGNTIQELEQKISKKLLIPEYIRSKQKRLQLFFPPNIKKASDLILEKFNKCLMEFENTAYLDNFYKEINIENFLEFDGLNFLNYENTKAPIPSDESTLEGEYVALRGKFLFTKTANGIIEYNLEKLIGKNFL